jgi:hypothetical protein
MQASRQDQSITNRHDGPMLPPSLLLVGPKANLLTVLSGPVAHGRDHVGAATTVIVAGAMSSPQTGTGAAVNPQVDIIFSLALDTEDLKPVGANLPNSMVVTFPLNLLGVVNSARHALSPPSVMIVFLTRINRRNIAGWSHCWQISVNGARA